MLCDDCLHSAICENITQGNCGWYLSEKELKEKWIPVSERLPEEGKSVLVCVKTQGGISQFVSERFHEKYWSALCGMVPFAWQPLPEPYKKGGAE